MADYTWSVGSSGTMLIRDTGTYVEFWLKAGSGTYNHALPWGYTINGTTDNTNSFDFVSGGSWQRLLRRLVTTDQTVTFRLFDTGTSGLGGGETHSVAVDRTSVPLAPTIKTLTPTSGTSIAVNMDSNGNGGLTVDQWQLVYSESSTMPSSPDYIFLSLSNGTGTVTGLEIGNLVYFWARGHNAKGWGPWSARKSARTWDYPSAPTKPVASQITQDSAVFTFSDGANGGTPIIRREIGWKTNPLGALTIVPSTGSSKITGLPGGDHLYVYARTVNAVGPGPWSIALQMSLVAGARVYLAGAWHSAVPYVRVGGVWKVATAYVKIAGLWKGTK